MHPNPRNTPARGLTRRHLLGAAGAASATAALAACGGDERAREVAELDDYTPGSAELRVQLGEEIDGPVYPEGYEGPRARASEPFGNGKEFTVVTRSVADLELETNAFTAFLEEQTGVKVRYETVPMGDEGTPKVNAMIASDDLPDAFMLGPEWMGGFTRSQMYVYGDQGLFQPLDRLIDEWAPQAVELFGLFPEVRDFLTTPNNAMYAFPAINQCFHCQSNYHRAWVNSSWMDEVGATEDPTTTEELTALLREFKKAHPDDKPMSGQTGYPVIRYTSMSFLNPGRELLRRHGDMIQYAPVLDEYRDAIAYTAQLVAEGLLDGNAFTQDSEQFQRLTSAPDGPRVGVCLAGSQSEISPIDFDDPHSSVNAYRVIRPVAGPHGGPWVPWAYDPGATVGLAITRKCTDPATLIRWADYQLSLVSTLSQRLGLRDKTWKWASKTQKGLSGGQGMWESIDVDDADSKNQAWWEWGPLSLVLDVRNGEVVDPHLSIEPSLYDAGKLYQQWAAPEEESFFEPYFTVDQAGEVGEYKTNIESAYTQGVANFCLGRTDIANDADWDAYLSAIRGAGLERYLEILTEADAASR